MEASPALSHPAEALTRPLRPHGLRPAKEHSYPPDSQQSQAPKIITPPRDLLAQSPLCIAKSGMTTREEAVEQLRVIRTMMERATIFRALSGETALMGGAAALAAAWMSDGKCGWSWAYYWLIGLGLVLIFNVIQILRASSSHHRVFWSTGLRTALRGAFPSLVAGGFLGLLYVRIGVPEQTKVAACIWILNYGIALLAIREFAPRSMIWLGWAFVTFGLLCLGGLTYLSGFLSHTVGTLSASHLMAIAFGGFHLLYGGIIVTTGRRDESPA